MKRAIDRIKAVHVPLLLKRMEEKAADYNSTGSLPFEPHTVLGIKGQWADIWRKVWKLHKALWMGETLKGEQPLEIIDDMIAHLLLTRDLLVMEVPEPVQVMVLKLDMEPEEESLPSHRVWKREEIDKAANLAADGNPAELEGMGLILHEHTQDGQKGCGSSCGPLNHLFTGSCIYRIHERRTS